MLCRTLPNALLEHMCLQSCVYYTACLIAVISNSGVEYVPACLASTQRSNLLLIMYASRRVKFHLGVMVRSPPLTSYNLRNGSMNV